MSCLRIAVFVALLCAMSAATDSSFVIQPMHYERINKENSIAFESITQRRCELNVYHGAANGVGLQSLWDEELIAAVDEKWMACLDEGWNSLTCVMDESEKLKPFFDNFKIKLFGKLGQGNLVKFFGSLDKLCGTKLQEQYQSFMDMATIE